MRFYAVVPTITILFILRAAGQDVEANPQLENEPSKSENVPRTGERDYLSPHMKELQDLAKKFMPASVNFSNVIKAFREITNEVRLELIVNAVNTEAENADIICRLVILEKACVQDSKAFKLQHSNCTAEATDGFENQLNFNCSLFKRSSLEKLSDDEIKDLQDQIIPSSELKRSAPSTNANVTDTENASFENQEQQQVVDETISSEADGGNNK